MYLIKTPVWLKKIYPSFIWSIPTKDKKIYLSFDDGPHSIATPFVLETLRSFNAKATFFCIGKNVLAETDLYNHIREEGHAIGNHTYNHLNGWKTKTSTYIENTKTAQKHIQSNFFRPPYGRIKKSQSKVLQNAAGFRIIMWDVLSGDFDTQITPQHCLKNVITHTKSGSIVVFHDSIKALSNMQYALPKMLEYFIKKEFAFEIINPSDIEPR